MKEQNYIRIREDGIAEHVQEILTPREITGEFLDLLGSKSRRRITNVFRNGGSPVGIVVCGMETYAYKYASSLSLNTQYKINKDKTLTPVFLHRDEKDSEEGKRYPSFVGKWLVPSDMSLMYAAQIVDVDSMAPSTSYDHKCFLIAWDGAGRAFRLPLPNLFDNCDMCTGKFDGMGDSIEMAFDKACNQMEKSEWNNDLLDAGRLTGAEAMFRFKTSEANGEMECIPFEGDWKKHCPKVANAVTEILKP